MLKKTTILLDDINDKAFRIGDLVKVRILDMFGNNDIIGRIMDINDSHVTLDTSVEYCSDQRSINFNKVFSINKVE